MENKDVKKRLNNRFPFAWNFHHPVRYRPEKLDRYATISLQIFWIIFTARFPSTFSHTSSSIAWI
jgi:hypothetical protein